MHDRRFASDTFNPDVLDVVQAARQQRAEKLRALFLRSPVERDQQNEHITALSRLWSRLMRDARTCVRRTR